MAVIDRALDPLGLVRRSTLSARRGGADPVRASHRAVTAAARRLGDPLVTKTIKGQRWQDRVFRFRDEIGEVRESAEFFGRNLARVRLLVQEERARDEWVEATDGPVVDALGRLQGPAGNADAIKSAYGELQFLVGEGYLFGYRDQGEGEAWEFLSTSEVKYERTSDGPRIKRKPRRDTKAADERSWPVADGLPLPEGQAIALRLWNPHPQYSDDADSPMIAVLDVCEELRLLPRAVRSRARSRLAGAGILAIPDSITDGPAEGREGMDEDAGMDPVFMDIMEASSTAIRDEESAAAVVPIILRADAEGLKGIQHIKFVDPAQAYPETDREVHVLKRFAQGLNLPPEVLFGMADVNHWGSWQISEATWTSHIEPVCRQLCADLTSAYLWPQLDDPRRYRIWYDDAGLVTKPDRAGDAREAHDRLVISDAALRDAMDFDDADAPKERELVRRIGVMLGDAGLAVTGEVTESSTGAPAGDGGEPSAGPAEQVKGPPATGDEAVTAAAVRVAVARCRAAAGARVLTRLQRERDRPDLNGTPRAEVCAALGREAVEALGLEATALVAGGAECLTDAGFPRTLARAVERQAARGLYEPTNGGST